MLGQPFVRHGWEEETVCQVAPIPSPSDHLCIGPCDNCHLPGCLLGKIPGRFGGFVVATNVGAPKKTCIDRYMLCFSP